MDVHEGHIPAIQVNKRWIISKVEFDKEFGIQEPETPIVDEVMLTVTKKEGEGNG